MHPQGTATRGPGGRGEDDDGGGENEFGHHGAAGEVAREEPLAGAGGDFLRERLQGGEDRFERGDGGGGKERDRGGIEVVEAAVAALVTMGDREDALAVRKEALDGVPALGFEFGGVLVEIRVAFVDQTQRGMDGPAGVRRRGDGAGEIDREDTEKQGGGGRITARSDR